ncbi:MULTISPECIES: hypothetical protein [Pseudomonas]|jgi:hypothetical protein|uniref:hypothetical protein n=1 Tax=Pseudomonas TaxID=286 RepID=UPI0007E3932A|nr:MULTISPECIES: hypothetical protein [Pseudomonas]
MDSTSAQKKLNGIGVGNKVYLAGKFDFPTGSTNRYEELVSVDQNSATIKRPTDKSGANEVITYDKIDMISATPPDPSNIKLLY